MTMDALKNWFNPGFYEGLADVIGKAHRPFDVDSFYRDAVDGLETLSLKERLQRTAQISRKYLPDDFRRAVQILYKVAPFYDGEFTGMFCPEFVGLYGLDDFEFSLDALEYFTPFSSSEMAVREFLRRDPKRTLRVMERWSRDSNDHVRRLSSEGCRPRLPWSARLDALIADPTPVVPILENLKADLSLSVRKSVANHLNDISKDHPVWMLNWVSTWDRSNPRTAWIVKRAVRSLIKVGHPRAFSLLGFERRPKVTVRGLKLSAKRIKLGQELRFSLALKSGSKRPQVLAVDYKVHYVKKSGSLSPKVFKLKEFVLQPGEEVEICKAQCFEDFSTRRHYAGIHRIEAMINGVCRAEGAFRLVL